MIPFDPNGPARLDSGIFGLPIIPGEEASLVYLPVPWEATASYGGGTAQAPAAILSASRQVDLYDLEVERPYEAGLLLLPESPEVHEWNAQARSGARRVMDWLARGEENHPQFQTDLAEVNALGRRLNEWVKHRVHTHLEEKKIVAVLGGDHSTPLGAWQAMGDSAQPFGILQVDAHTDLRKAYEGFTWSHASIFYNALESIPKLHRLVQVGVRDVCQEEMQYASAQGSRVVIHSSARMAETRFRGESFHAQCQSIIAPLPERVWISVDIDGLDPKLCPHTGTPVPGGLSWEELGYLLVCLVQSRRKIVGFDLCEVAPGSTEWDANVGARLLYRMTGLTLASQGRARLLANAHGTE